MASKPESTFHRAIHKKLRGVYFEKMSNPWRAGTPDVWYSGPKRDLWIEYKWLPTTPQRGIVQPNLSPRQARWLNDRKAEGRNVAVVVGCPGGCHVYRSDWETGMPAKTFIAGLISRQELSQWIMGETGACT